MFPLLGLGFVAMMLLSGTDKGAKKPPTPATPPLPPHTPPPTPPNTPPRTPPTPPNTPPPTPPKMPSPPRPIPEAFRDWMGRRAYQPEVAASVIDRLIYMVALPSELPNLAMVHPGPETGAPMGPNDWGAWYGLMALHEKGFDLWVPVYAHIPGTEPWPVLFIKPSDPLPPADGYALLIAHDEQWPPMPAV